MTMTKLPKRVIDAIGKHPLFWAYFQPEFGTRTVTAGFALYAVTVVYENGHQLDKRLCVAPSVDRAKEINKLVMSEIWDPSVRRKLELNLDRVIDRWRCSLERNRIR